MLHNNLKFSIRNIKRNRLFSAINIFGLAISLTAFLLMALYIENERSFDRFHEKASRIYRVADDKQTPDILLRSAASAAPVAPALLADYPEIQEAARIKPTEALVKYENKLFEERNIFYADPSLLNIFSFEMVKGNPANALQEPMSVILTQQIAGKYFGTADPLDKILRLDDKNMKVTGVIKNIPANSHLSFDFLVSMSTAMLKGSGNEWLFTNWYSNNFYTYLLLPKNYDITKLSAGMEDFDNRHHKKGSTTKHHYVFEKLTDIYLHSDRENQVGKTGSITNLYVFSAVALIILLVACVNFINLSTARAAERAKEVAIKKVAGAAKGQMVMQFFTESFLMTAISLLLAIILTSAFLEPFNNFSGKSLSLDLFSPIHITCLLGLLICIALLSGSYPAFILSGFKPATALKGKIRASVWSIGIRKGLVVFQFAVSIVLIVCSLVIYRQLQFMQQHDLGFKSSQTMVINFEGDNTVQQQNQTIRRQMLNIAGVRRSLHLPMCRETGMQKHGLWTLQKRMATRSALN
jgi:putative ABC transport system permease protein